jgi:hypothetical protein
MRKMLLTVCAAIVAITFAPSSASARHRIIVHHVRGVIGWSAADFCGGRLPAYGTDACGNREFSYGPGSCYRRAVVYTRSGPVARRVGACG